MKLNSIKGIYIKYSMISCFIMTLITLITYGIYSSLSLKEIFLLPAFGIVPLSVALLGTSLFLGAIIGISIEAYLNQSINELSKSVLELERGTSTYNETKTSILEFKEIETRIYQMSQRLESQAIALQKNTNERVQKDQEILEQAISQERSRLARELHDSVSQQLFAISMMSSALNETTEAGTPLKKQLQLVEDMSIQAQSEMRALLLHLRPIQLEGKKLIDGMTELLTELVSKQHMGIVWYIDEDLELEKGVEDHLFRILQEAISNTLRHGKAKNLEVRLRKIESFAMLRIIDDGIGFDSKIRKAGSYGLGTMQERANEIGGTLKIISMPTKGTQIEVKVPLQKMNSSID